MTKYIINGQAVKTTNSMIKVTLDYGNGQTVIRNLYVGQAQMIINAMVKDGVKVTF
jgi:hypothetical protein